MLKTFKYAIGAALIAGAHLACADTAEVKISNLNFSVQGGGWWAYIPTEVDWVSPTAGSSAALLNPSFADAAGGWHGYALTSSAMDGAHIAQAQLTAKTAQTDMNGVTALAKVDVNGGQAGWAFAKIFDGQILVSGNATVTVSFTLDSLLATGNQAQANASIEFCSTDFVTDTCEAANYAEAFVDAASPAYTGPSILTASWTNTSSDNTWAKMRIGLSASADSFATPVPEPTTTALWLAGLAGVGAIARRRKI
jgi:PEP-CTERM motif